MISLDPVWISLKTTLFSFGVVLIASALIAWRVFLCRSWKLRSFWDGLISLPMVLPPTVTGFLLLLLFGSKGLFGSALAGIGISFAFDVKGAVLASAVVALPLLYRSMLAGFDEVDPSQIQAARTLGFGSFQIFYRILLPEARSSIVSGSILAMARGLGEFGATAMLAGNIPGKTRTLPLAVYSAVMAGDWDTAGFYAVILIGVALAAIWGLNGYLALVKRKRKYVGSKRKKETGAV